MAADPLKEVLQKVVFERHSQIATLNQQLQTSFDPIVRDELEKKITQLQAELAAAQGALNQPQTPAPQPVPQQPTPAQQPQPQPLIDQQVINETPAVAPKGPSKAALEAQIRELQTQLLDAARAVEKGGANPNKMDVSHLAEIREKLATAMRQIGEVDDHFDVGELPPKPTPAQLSEADNLIKRSMLEKQRGNKAGASDLLRKAAEVAPGSPAVLEALGDDMMERGQAKPAAETYAIAKAIQPGNQNIERKHAMAIGKSKGTVTIDEAMQMALGDGNISAAEAANVKVAALFSFFIPGSGQIILGDYVKGGIYLLLWVGFITWLKLQHAEVSNLIDSMLGKRAGFNPVIILPLLGTLVIAIAAAFTCKSSARGNVGELRKAKGSRPAPPVDLPFE